MPELEPSQARRKRIRLAPDARKKLILEAALAEFSTHGYAASSTEKIARRAGLAQAGLYAHFKSKEAILEALFSEVLLAAWPQWLEQSQSFSEEQIDLLIDKWYARIDDPKFLAVLRLLVVEGVRLPAVVRDWRTGVVAPFMRAEQETVDSFSSRGHIRPGPLADHFQLATAPLAYVILMHLINGTKEHGFGDEIAKMREAHRQMLKTFLVP